MEARPFQRIQKYFAQKKRPSFFIVSDVKFGNSRRLVVAKTRAKIGVKGKQVFLLKSSKLPTYVGTDKGFDLASRERKNRSRA
jgi:hypothetical protein